MNTITLHIPEQMVLQAQNMGLYHEQAILSAFQKMLDEKQSHHQVSELQQRFMAWENYHQNMIVNFDENEMTDEQYDDYCASLRDKNDIGREVVFE